MTIESVTAPEESSEEKGLETTLRPQTLPDYIGQDNVKQNLRILITAAKQRSEAIEHVLLHGGPGLGKTTLAHIIAKEMGVNIIITSGPAIERTGDLAAILSNMKANDILFIDEIHRLHKTVEELLYPAMEDYALDIVVGKGPAARTLRIDLPHFTVIGATTRVSLMAAPLLDRFGAHYKLDFYSDDDMIAIVLRSARVLGIEMNTDTAREIAVRSRKTPRIANRLLKRVRDYAQVHHNGTLTADVACSALDLLNVDSLGLNSVDHKLLHCMIEKFKGGPVGVGTLAAATGEEVETIEEIHEPFLMQLGFLMRTPRGRIVTQAAYQHLNIPYTSSQQRSLLE
ncbi:MAG: Holliday junction branch migration DNA helicase RuvB [Candidatus Kerfeldbacteria bacterium]|nr:Holliday junction branch migration DNA helicase RuvB [Candidatus Kerfeldbacteria bacterium]